jgi:RND family efflux transporter MFP subunit
MVHSRRPHLFFLPAHEEKQKYSALFVHRSLFNIAGAAALAFALTACKEEPRAEPGIRPVKAVVIQQDSGARTKSFSGDIRARTVSTLGFRISGKIVERLVDLGDQVSVGQVIARLDDTDLILSENSARAAVQSADTRLAVARDALARAQALQPKGYTPNAVVDQRRLEVDAAEAAREAAKAQARQAANATTYAVLKADESGIVTQVRAEAGQVVAAGAPVVLVAASGDMEIALSVPEQDVSQLSMGQTAQLSLWADKDVKARGKISEIAGQADPGSRTYGVRVAIADPPPAMRLGMTATVDLKLGSQAPYMPVPLPALTEIQGRKAVFVVNRATSTVAPRFVETRGATAGALKVVSGIQPGDIVVTGGVQFLADGMRVRLPENVVQTASATAPNPHR